MAQVEEKRVISLAAAGTIKDGDIIGLETGSTILELAKVIARRAWKNLQVVTNSFLIIDKLMRTPGVRLVFVGGTVYPDEMGTYGTLTADMLKHISVDKLFIGCRGIEWEMGLSTDISSDAQANVTTVRAFAEAAHQVIVLADHTKFGQVFLMQIIPISDVDIVITDSLTSKNMLSKLRERGTRVVQASLNDLDAAEAIKDGD
jgi:DeoR/GlpR family transcriptional regulator of sugar metabolism